MRITVLIENTKTDGMLAEHGLCLYVEYGSKAYLIDSGASRQFATNAENLSIDLDKVEKAFLSHAHYDHSGGYEEFFERNRHAKVCLQRSAKNRYYYKIIGPIKKYIGLPEGILSKYEDRFEYIDGAANIDEGIHIVPHSSDGILERAKKTHMCVAVGKNVKFDDFSHEQTVVFEEPDGLVCFNSCSHAGVDIIMDEVKRAFPDKRVKAYIGGFHMMGATGVTSCGYKKEEVRAVANKLLGFGDTVYYSGHCTGLIAFDWLKDTLQERLVAIRPGKVFEL